MTYVLVFWLGGFFASALSVAVAKRLGLVNVVNYAELTLWPVLSPYNWTRLLLRQREAQRLEQKLGEPRYCDSCHVLHEAMTCKSHEAHALRREWNEKHGNCIECGILLTRWRNGDREARA